MKITGNTGISVNIPAARELGSLFKNIIPGDVVSASIIKSEGSRAYLDIGGKVISAEFTNGIPGDKTIELVLTAKSSEKIQFTLKDETTADKILKFLFPFSVLHDDELKKSPLQNFARFVNSSRPDLLDLNLFLLGFKKDQRKEKNNSSLFNKLLQKGVPFQTLIDLSSMIYSKYNPVLFMSYQYMLAMTGKKTFLSKKEDLSYYEKSIEQFCDVLKEDDSDFSLMLELVFDDYKNSKVYGEISYPDDGIFSGFEYVINSDSVFLKFELSSIGDLGVLVKSEKEQILINFLSGKEEALQFIRDNEKELKKMLEKNGIKKSIIGYFDSEKIVDKIKLWSLDFYTKSGFNVKV